MSRHNTPIDEWRGCKAIDSTKPTEGLFRENTEEARVETEVVGCIVDNQLSISGKDSQQPTTSIDKSIPKKKESVDLNSINPDLEAIPPFPIWGLPAILQEMTEQGAKVYGVPVEFFAMPIFQAIGSMLRKNIYTQGKFRNHPQLWTVLVAQSGIGKSYPMNMALKPISDIDSLSHNDYLEKHSAWEKEQASKKKGKDKWTPEPIFSQIIIEDTTPEALFKALSHNPKGLLLYRDEIIGWFKDIGRYNKSGELQHYLSLFDGKSLTINRKTQMTLRLENPFLSVLGSVQPNVLVKWLQDPTISDNGFIQRFLFVFPDNVKKPMPNNEVIPDIIINNYNALITKIGGLSLGQNGTGKEIHFTDDARRLLYDYECKLTHLHNETECDYLQAMYDKMLIHVNRLAIIIAVARYCAIA